MKVYITIYKCAYVLGQFQIYQLTTKMFTKVTKIPPSPSAYPPVEH